MSLFCYKKIICYHIARGCLVKKLISFILILIFISFICFNLLTLTTGLKFIIVLIFIFLSLSLFYLFKTTLEQVKRLKNNQKELQSALNEKLKELKKLTRAIESSPVSIVITDKRGNIEYINPKFSQITGYLKEEAIGQNPRILQTGKTDRAVYNDMWKTISQKKEWQGELLNRTKYGDEYWEDARISPILDEDGDVTHYVAVKEDITLKKRNREQMLYLARHDALTSLINRQYFLELLKSSIKKPIALLYIDLDGFKGVNDNLGHNCGDLLLVQVAKRLKDLLRANDVLARLGGDEFVLMIRSGVSKEGVEVVAQKIIDEIAKEFTLGGNKVKISASIGIAFSKEEQDPKELLICADEAMYEAKNGGKNRFQISNK